RCFTLSYGTNVPSMRYAAFTGYHFMPVNALRRWLFLSRTRMAGRSPLSCTHTWTSPSTRRSGGPSPSDLIGPPANGLPSSSFALTPGSSVTLTFPFLASTNVPTRGGALDGSTTSFAASDPTVVSGLVRKDRPAIVSQPVSDVNLASRCWR